MKNIKILIACHKPTALPQNSLFLPIHVGAALSDKNLGLQRDDDGKDNISTKNAGYCELTAIYWAWKNLEADYYGLFHYRRYYSFADKKFPTSTDGHMMVKPGVLSPEVFAKYELLNQKKMRQMIEANDIIVHESRPIRNIPTPRSVSASTVKKHYQYHDGTITNNKDIDLMMQLVNQKYPEIATFADKYMKGRKFLGYNMFIMKKNLFSSMCRFEFDILSDLEKQTDLTTRSQNANRLYGYLAEILTSIYIDYLRKTHPKLKVKELQMVYADKTDSIVSPKPIKGATPIIFEIRDNHSALLFAPVWQTFLQKTNSKKYYDAIIVHQNLEPFYINELQKMAEPYQHINLRFYDYSYNQLLLKLNGYSDKIDFKLLAPWLLQDYHKVIIVEWNIWFNGDITGLINLDKGHLIAAARDACYQGQLNDFGLAIKKRAIDIGLEPYKTFDDAVLVMNFHKIRSQFKKDELQTKVNAMIGQSLTTNEIFNLIFKDQIALMPQIWNYRLPSDSATVYGISLAPIDLFKEHQASGKNFIIGQFFKDAPLRMAASEFSLNYFNTARTTNLFPLIMKAVYRFGEPQHSASLKNRLFPIGSRRRRLAKKLFPSSSLTYKALRRLKNSL
jgi:hypothetical protein